MNKYDVVVIGSGIGGLVAAVTLAKEGRRVCVLEKNNQFGGNLQTFSRNKKIFDTGVHYIGGLAKGQNLYQYFSYLGIMDQLKLEAMPEVFDEVYFDDERKTYPIAQGYDAFVSRLLKDFPDAAEVLQRYIADLQYTCGAFPLYYIEDGEGYGAQVLGQSVKDYFDRLTTDERLRSVLIGNNFLYAGDEDKTPFYVHALAVNSYLQSAYRCVGGASQISKLLIRVLRKLGGEAYKREEVTAVDVANGVVCAVNTHTGKRIEGDLFIANIDPKKALQLVGKPYFRTVYYDRVQELPVTTSSFSVHIVLKSGKIPFRGSNLYYHDDIRTVWSAAHYQPEDWPNMYMLSMTEDPQAPGFADTVAILTYMHFKEVEAWASTVNTITHPSRRGDEYEVFKRQKAELLLDKASQHVDGLKAAVKHSYVSTPLTFRDYIGTHRGNLYGHIKDAKDPLKTFIAPKTKIANFYLTGQGIYMHGILGVTVGAIATCSEILGRSYLLNKIKEGQ